MAKTVLYAEKLYDNDKVEREVFGPDVRVVWRNVPNLAELEARDCADIDGLMVMRHAVTAEQLARFPKLACVVRMGVGYDKIDGIPPAGDPSNDDNLPKGKASIEVVRVGPSSSECRITRTSYGTQIFLPFYAGHYTADAVFIVDFTYSALMITGLLLVRMVRRQRQQRYGRASLVWVGLGGSL